MNVSGATKLARCPRQFYFGNTLDYSTAHKNANMLLGTWGHYALALAYTGMSYEAAVQVTIDRQWELWNKYWVDPSQEQLDLFEKLEHLVVGHGLWQSGDTSRYADKYLDWISAEEKFELTHEGQKITGITDGIVRHKQTRDLYVFERKITTRAEELCESVAWDLQPRVYTWATEQLRDEQVRGVIFEIIRNCDPFKIPMLKNGLPSKAKSVGSTYEIYFETLEKAIEATGADRSKIADYADILDYHRKNRNPVYRRFVLDITPGQKRQAVQEMLRRGAQADMVDMIEPEEVGANLNRYDCYRMCPFKDICQAMDDGADWRGALDEQYIQHQERVDAE
jgi:hypothetical protein